MQEVRDMNANLRERLIQAAQGKLEPDLLLKNAQVLNVFTGEVITGDVAIIDGYIAGIGRYDKAKQVTALYGRYLVPGFINAHCHVESSMVLPGIYCAEELRWGTTTLITDPHEVANVAGNEGIKFMLDSVKGLPVNYYVQLPSCVPATPFEHSGAALNAAALEPMLNHPGVLGLGEMMNYIGVLETDPDIMDKLAMAEGRVIDGHGPGLSGLALQAYVAAGIHTDHESTSFEEALEKLRAGMSILVREGSASKNLEAIISGMIKHGLPTYNMAFCTDDKHIADIRREGTIRHCIRRSIALGLPAADAYRMATINAARIYGLKDLGAAAPGYRADLVVLEDLDQVAVIQVYKDGKPVDPQDVLQSASASSKAGMDSVRVAALNLNSFALPKSRDGLYPVVGAQPNQIVTTKAFIGKDEAEKGLQDGTLCKLAVIERHHATGNTGVGLLSGYGLQNGAVASTVGHDSHNLIVVGTNDEDMLTAAKEISRIGGGYVLVRDGVVAGTVPLPVYGLMSNGHVENFIITLNDLLEKAHMAGVPEGIDPFITLSFLALPVIPALRVTDMGVFDVEAFRFI